jgi:SagB-type dehydrogenase family enzyme
MSSRITHMSGAYMRTVLKNTFPIIAIAVLIAMLSCTSGNSDTIPSPEAETSEQGSGLRLPEPQYDSEFSIEQSLLKRRSIRDYTGEPVTIEEVSQLLWAVQGITDSRGLRTAPSAGATYPLEIYLVAGNVLQLEPGVYRYIPSGHFLEEVIEGDVRADLAEAALMQKWMEDGAVMIVITAVYERTTRRYGERGIRYVHMEAGHAAQNLYLQATAMELGTVVVGAFQDDQVAEILQLPQEERPLYLIPVGKMQG